VGKKLYGGLKRKDGRDYKNRKEKKKGEKLRALTVKSRIKRAR